MIKQDWKEFQCENVTHEHQTNDVAFIPWHFLFVSVHLIFADSFSVPEILHCSEKHHLNKGQKLAKNKPAVNHSDFWGGGQALHLADEDGRHDQHGRQVHTEGGLEEEGLEECGGKGDGNQQKRWEVGRHHLTGDLSPKHNHHLDPIFLAPLEFPINDWEANHVSSLGHFQFLRNKFDCLIMDFSQTHINLTRLQIKM